MGALPKAAKIFHFIGLILWLGPSTGGYILFLLARLQENRAAGLWIFKEYINLVRLETFGLALMVTTGLIMRSAVPQFKKSGWLKAKMAIVFSVFVPFEAIQLYIFNFVVKKNLRVNTGIEDAVNLFDSFSLISFIVLSISVPTVFWLVVFKPGKPKS